MLTMYRQVPRAFNALIARTRFKYDSEGGSKYTGPWHPLLVLWIF